MSKKKRKLNADIWASTEEVLYHKHVDHVDLEGTFSAGTQWWYRDNQQQQLQGPFSTEQMQAWNQAGFFPPTTPVRKGNGAEFVEMGSIDWNAQIAANKKSQTGKKKKKKQKNADNDVDDRIAALKAQENKSETNGVEERIAELKARDDNADDERLSEEAGIEGMILPLRRQNEEGQQQEEQDSVEARIAALKGEKSEVIQPEEEEESSTVQDRINALTSERVAEHVEENKNIGVGPTQTAHQDDDVQSYHVHMAAQESHPAYYPLPEDMEGDEAVAPYPSGLEYPANDAYPVDDHYPLGNGDVSDYPVVAPYPTDDDAYPANDSAPEPTKKIFKANKEVVGLVPTNLQRRRATKPAKAKLKAKTSPAPSCQDNSSKPNSKSVADDYEDFMKEINDLK